MGKTTTGRPTAGEANVGELAATGRRQVKLSDAALRGNMKPGRHFDGGGLYVEVTPAGRKYFRLKYRVLGKEKLLALGVYPDVSLKQARERRDEARRTLARGDDPGELRKAEKVKAEHEARTTFKAVAEDWLTHQAASWADVTLERIRAGFDADVYPAFGARPMAGLKPRDVIEAVRVIEGRGAGEQAARTLQRIRAVFRFAVVHERIETNPMLDLKAGELLKPRTVTHRAALADKDLPAYLQALDAYQGDPTTTAALRLLMLTALRPGELRTLRWSDLDTDAAELRIPAERMKMKAAHVVPLSRQALAVIETQRAISGDADLIFPSPFYPGKALSENTLNSALARLGYKGEHTAHGCRAVFSTVANEAGHDADVIERQLAHRERNAVRAAYHRAEYLAERRNLLQWWADYIDARRQGARIIPFGRKVSA
jgi:integrase